MVERIEWDYTCKCLEKCLTLRKIWITIHCQLYLYNHALKSVYYIGIMLGKNFNLLVPRTRCWEGLEATFTVCRKEAWQGSAWTWKGKHVGRVFSICCELSEGEDCHCLCCWCCHILVIITVPSTATSVSWLLDWGLSITALFVFIVKLQDYNLYLTDQKWDSERLSNLANMNSALPCLPHSTQYCALIRIMSQ